MEAKENGHTEKAGLSQNLEGNVSYILHASLEMSNQKVSN